MSFDARTELLIRSVHGPEWLPIARLFWQWADGKRPSIAAYKPETGEVVWATPENVFRRNYEGDVVSLEHFHASLFVTSDHNFLTCQLFEGKESGTWDFRGERVFGFWNAGVGSVTTNQWFFLQQTPAEKRENKLIVFRKTTGGSATLFPELVALEDLEVTKDYGWSGPTYELAVPSKHIVVRRNDKIVVVGCG